MYCPKCGSQNVDEARFCRGCGADLSNVLAVVEGRPVTGRSPALEHINLYTSGLRNVIMAFGFAALAFIVAMIPGDTHFWVMFLIPAFPLLATGISRLVRADKLKALAGTAASERAALPQPGPALTSGRQDYASPFETDNPPTPAASVTEHTTRHLEK